MCSTGKSNAEKGNVRGVEEVQHVKDNENEQEYRQEETFSKNSLKINEPGPGPHNPARKDSRTGMFPSQSLKAKPQPHVATVKKMKPAHTMTLGSFSQVVPLHFGVYTESDTSSCSWLSYTETW